LQPSERLNDLLGFADNSPAAAARRLADDAPLRERLGKAARFHAEQHLDREPVLTRFLEGLRGVCAARN